jgi:hypothetical protein
MLLFLVCLFVVATAIGSYVAVAVAGAMLGGDREQHPAGSPPARA